MITFKRYCPTCNKELEYKNEIIFKDASRLNKKCRQCTTRVFSERVNCYLCSENFYRESEFFRHLTNAHQVDNSEPMKIYMQVHGLTEIPKCLCGCSQNVTWQNWRKGFRRVIQNHNGAIYQVQSPERAKEISNNRKEKLTGRIGWSKGLSKKTDVRIASRSLRIKKKNVFIHSDAYNRVSWSKNISSLSDFVSKDLSFSIEHASTKFDLSSPIDVFVPHLLVGIDLHNNKRSKQHDIVQLKSSACERKGVSLIHVFDDEWHDKSDIIKSIIARRLGVSITSKGHELKFNVPKFDCDLFMFENHILGPVEHFDGSVALYNAAGDIDAMCLWINVEGTCKVIRTAPALGQSPENYLVRLINAIKTVTDAPQIEAEVDTRFFTGRSWTELGFKFTSREDQFWYTDGKHRYHQFEIDEDFNESLFEKVFSAEKKILRKKL